MMTTSARRLPRRPRRMVSATALTSMEIRHRHDTAETLARLAARVRHLPEDHGVADEDHDYQRAVDDVLDVITEQIVAMGGAR